MKEMEKIEDQIEKKHNKIDKLNEQAHKTSIKNQILGKDADKNEYWFFKEDPSKLYIKKQEQTPTKDDAMDIDEQIIEGHEVVIPIQEPRFFWVYYDEEDEFDKLVDGCNTKGIRERKLQEALRKIRDRIKMKKSSTKKDKSKEAAADAEMKDDEEEKADTS